MTTRSPVGVGGGVGAAVAVATGGASVGGTESWSGAIRDFGAVGVVSISENAGSGVAKVTLLAGKGTDAARSSKRGSSITTRSGRPSKATMSSERARLDTS